MKPPGKTGNRSFFSLFSQREINNRSTLQTTKLSGLFVSNCLRPFRILFFLIAAPPALFIVILYFAVDNWAITQKNWELTQNDIQRAVKIVDNAKTQNTIRLNEKDLNIALNYLLNHYISSSSEITVKPDHLAFKITLFINKLNFRKFINCDFKLTKKFGYPVIYSLQIGDIIFADELAGKIIKKIIKHTALKEYYFLAVRHIKDVLISNKDLTISYITPADQDLKNELSLNNKNFRSVIFYQNQITGIIAKHNPRWRLSLAKLFQPLFKQAYHRSSLETAIAENRAVLIAISSYVNKTEIQAYVPFDISPTTPLEYPASMYRRTDMAKHFMASAVLAAAGAETFAYTLGQQKELNDAKKGSGFSFIDLAGDRAGLQFGKTAVATPFKARKLQHQISKIKDYTTFMPEVRDLPENMSDAVFKNKFGSVYSAEYQDMLKKIDQRIAGLIIYN